MHVSIFLTILLTLFSQLAQAKGLNGNLDYELRTEGQDAVLTLTNKRPETSATLRAVTVLLPANSQTPQGQLMVPIKGPVDISPKAKVVIGKISELAELIAPEKNRAAYQTITVSEMNNCDCESIGFVLKLNVVYPGGISQENLEGAFLNLVR